MPANGNRIVAGMKNGLLKLLALITVFCLSAPRSEGQQRYPVQLHCSGKDSVLLLEQIRMPLEFANKEGCAAYFSELPAKLKQRGYIAASIDSLYFGPTNAYLDIFLGEMYQWGKLNSGQTAPRLLEAVGKLPADNFDPQATEAFHQRIIRHLGNNGYPFATSAIDSLRFENGLAYGELKVDSGRRYTIDSIRVFGDVKINNRYLQKYLQLPNGSLYRTEKLEQISKRMRELPFLQETSSWKLSMLGTGSVVDLYLAPRKSNQIDVLIGFLPGTDEAGGKKFLLTGEAKILLKNALQQGETIGVDWQQLQQQSPRLNLVYNHPYVFSSNLGLDFSFDLYKKDSAYLNLTASAGIQYLASPDQTGKIFLQSFRTNLLTVDTFNIMQSRRLPDQIDMSILTLGITYQRNATNYKLNPRSGTEGELLLTAGQKKIRKNNGITGIKTPDLDFESLYDSLRLNSYQLVAKGHIARYFPIGNQSTFKTALQGAWLQSPDIFRNELFQIGGYRLLRGFDEQSIFVSGYAVLTAEYRYLLGTNSYLSAFADGAVTKNNSNYVREQGRSTGSNFIGAGIGMAFETKAGIFNLAFAMGKRSNQPFDFKQSKIHFGYVNYF